ncbi:MAG: hypothetical protein HN909_06705 [Phycisphaerales bacterium]|nr:hypothetical protein [Phycisphaerales bacterium]
MVTLQAQQVAIQFELKDGYVRWICPKCKVNNAATAGLNKCYSCNYSTTFTLGCSKCQHPFDLGTANCSKCKVALPKVYASNPNPNAKPIPKPKAAEQPKKLTPRQKADRTKRIKKLEAYYTMVYGQHLKHTDWFVRAVALAEMGKIDCKESTDELMKVLETDRDPMVRMYAWEVLHARSASLAKMPSYHRRWVANGAEAAYRGGFRGDLRVGLINAIAAYGPKPPGFEVTPHELIPMLLKTLSPSRPSDSRTLKALRELVATWKDPELTQTIAQMLSSAKTANKAEYLLGGLTDTIAPVGIYSKVTPSREWVKVRTQWDAWIKENLKTKTESSQAPKTPYVGKSTYFPQAETITDPDDPKWKKDLELGKLTINDIDLVFVIDSTGSMQLVMTKLAKNVTGILNTLKLFSRTPKIGAVYYRHEEDPALQMSCCKAALGKVSRYEPAGGKAYNFKDYRTSSLPLTSQITKLAATMLAQRADGAHYNPDVGENPGALHGGLLSATKTMKWSKNATAKKIIVLMGDAMPTKGTIPAIETLVSGEHSERNITFHSMRVVTEATPKYYDAEDFLPNFIKVAKLGGGTSLVGDFNKETSAPHGQIAPPHDSSDNFRKLTVAIIKGMINKDYLDRVDPVINVLVEYAQSPDPRK